MKPHKYQKSGSQNMVQGPRESPRPFQGICKVKIIFLFLILFTYLFIFGCAGSSLLCSSRGYSSLRCAGFSLQWLLLLQSPGSRHEGFSSCGTQALERRPSSCGARAQQLRSMWDLPGPGLEHVSPALAGGFLTTAPPGKPSKLFS